MTRKPTPLFLQIFDKIVLVSLVGTYLTLSLLAQLGLYTGG